MYVDRKTFYEKSPLFEDQKTEKEARSEKSAGGGGGMRGILLQGVLGKTEFTEHLERWL